jgi:signal transduction histidine kinase/ActR/RegA family two-component response regulator
MDDKVIVDLLGQVGRLFTSSLELKENIDFMLKATSDLVPCDTATVFLADVEGQRLRAMATFPYADAVENIASFQYGEGIVGWAAKHRRVVSVADATQDQRFKALREGTFAPRSFLLLPLESPRRLVGVLTLARRSVSPFTNLEQALVQIIASQAAISIDNARLHEQQKEQLGEINAQKVELEGYNAQIQEISRLKSEFLANMSHELRTPLNAILGFSEILKDNLAGELTPEQKQDCLENIHTSGKHLLTLVNDVLDLSKIEAGRMDLVYDTFEVTTALAEVRSVIRALTERRSLTLTADIEPPELAVRADKSKFKQVLYNLLTNAIKFTPGGGNIWLRAREINDELVVEVGDTGIGIAAEHQDKIFTEFYQVPGDARRQGTGLGLPLTKRFVALHGGSIGVESEEGVGSVFTVRLPAHGQPLTEEGGNAHRRILLVEDDASNAELTRMVLNGNGFDVDVAEDGQQGLDKARARRYDLVIMDVRLPVLDGLSVTRMLKSDPKTAAIPVVALTAHAMKGDEQRALAAGCAAYITKPIEVAQFVQRISSFMEASTR